MLNTSLALAGVDMHLETGILRSQVEQAEVLFLDNAQTRGGDENSHSEVPLRTSNTTAFDFPLGQQGRYLPVRLNANTAVTALTNRCCHRFCYYSRQHHGDGHFSGNGHLDLGHHDHQ